jgi:hypothetical protein
MTIMARLIAANVRQHVYVGVLTASVATALAVGSQSPAHAEPGWDIGTYDDCVQLSKGTSSPGGSTVTAQEAIMCCVHSGGVVSRAGCVAPAAQQPPDAPVSQPPAKPAPPTVMAPMAPIK